MSGLSLLFKTLSDLRWQVLWYGAGLALLAALVVYIFPSYRDQLAEFEIPEALRGFIGEADYTSPEGFVSAEFFSFVPVLVVIFAIMAGTSALAGEEVNGTLDLLLAQPVTRSALLLQKMAGFALAALLIVAVTCLGWFASVPFVDIEVSLLELAFATLRLVPLILVFGFFAMWLAALIPDRLQATAVVTAVAVVSYFISYLSTIVDAVAPLRWASFFYYHDGANALVDFQVWKLAVLLVAAAVFAALALVTFQRRDIGVSGQGLVVPWRGIPSARDKA